MPFRSPPCSARKTLPTLWLLLGLLWLGVAPAETAERYPIQVGGVPARVELADTAERRSYGLMHRERLEENQGMLFLYPESQTITLWMLNTRIPLDAGFFDQDGVLLGVVTMQPDGGRATYPSPAPVLYALEMPSGWFASHRIEIGSRLALSRGIPRTGR